MIDPHVVPTALAKHARTQLDGQTEPARPRHAATTILVRGGTPGVPGSVEVFMQRRPATMAFAAEALVFPGGSVDPSDGEAAIAWRGPAPAAWAERLGATDALATAVVCAAARELFEEAGVLLAGPADGPEGGEGAGAGLLSDLSDPAWEDARVALETRQTSMSEFLLSRGLALRSDLLAPWRSWLTPTFEPKRFNAQFLVAAAPAGQVARTVSGETTESLWISVADALRRTGDEFQMLPPQIFTCAELFEFDSAQDVVASARATPRAGITPHLSDGDDVRLEFAPELDEILARVKGKVG